MQIESKTMVKSKHDEKIIVSSLALKRYRSNLWLSANITLHPTKNRCAVFAG